MEFLDQSPGQVNKITQTIDRLTAALGKASAASEHQGRKLNVATWALVGATIALLVVSGTNVYLTVVRTPEDQARRDVAYCTQIARIMVTPEAFKNHLSRPLIGGDSTQSPSGPWNDLPRWGAGAGSQDALYGITLSCLLGKR